MVNARHQRRAPAVIFDQLKLPKWLSEVERFACLLADIVFEVFFGAASRQFSLLDVVGNIEFLIDLSPRAGWVLHRLLLKARVRQETLFNGRFELRKCKLIVENHDPNNHHQIGGVFHP